MIPIDSKSVTVTDSLILDNISGDTPNDILYCHRAGPLANQGGPYPNVPTFELPFWHLWHLILNFFLKIFKPLAL